MKLNKDALVAQFTPILDFLKQYKTFLFIITFLGVYAYLIINVSSLTQSEPTAAQLSESAGAVRRLKVDEESIEKLQDLEEQNIQVQALFEQARNNPFTE